MGNPDLPHGACPDCWAGTCKTNPHYPSECGKTDAENDFRRPNDGSYGGDGASTLAYRVHFEDEGWWGYLYCPGCVLGVELVAQCSCDPNDRDEFCVCIVDCVPGIKIRDAMTVSKYDHCVSCGVPLYNGRL